MSTVADKALAAWEEARDDVLDARRGMDIRQRARDRQTFAALCKTVLGVMPPDDLAPEATIDGLHFFLGQDKDGLYQLRVKLACPDCERSYGDWGFHKLLGLGEILSGEQEHVCTKPDGDGIVGLVHGPRWRASDG